MNNDQVNIRTNKRATDVNRNLSPFQTSCYVPNSIDRIKFDFSTAVARRLKPSRATAV